MYTFISPTGERKSFKTVKAFSDKYNICYSAARSLACGSKQTANGWCSTRVKTKKRRRFETKVINTITNQEFIVGQSAQRFARTHGLNGNAFNELLKGHRLCYRNWMLRKTYDNAFGFTTAGIL